MVTERPAISTGQRGAVVTEPPAITGPSTGGTTYVWVEDGVQLVMVLA